ncbi:unnamed protein product [Symbiodinium necroappetens]|uniref:Reverse transcriptase domain-containing protein n=1 Tax=Symbiodinium necroappetens TaxID=1628268 RepID=A0A812RX57_9DINO|nr:unnamed protein product [Symbiodinium necroappetens]
MVDTAIKIYRGGRYVTGESVVSPKCFASKGIMAGCPVAFALAKVVLFPALSQLHQSHLTDQITAWLDDVSVDADGKPAKVAHRIHKSFKLLKKSLSESGFTISISKTCFVRTDKTTEKALQLLLGEDDPPVTSLARDLGTDYSGDTHCAICGRSWAKQIAKKKKEKEAKAEQASWKVPGWPMWPTPTGAGGGNPGPKAELGKVSSALAEVWQDLPEATQKALTKVGCKAPRLPSPPPGLRVPSSLQGSMTQQEYQAARTVVYSGAGDHVQKLLAAAGIPPPEDVNLGAPEITPGQRLTRVVTEFRKSTNQMQKLVKKRAMLQAKADRLKEELEALMLDVAQVGCEIENKDAEMKDTAREFKELTEDKATTAFGQMEQVLAEAGHELAEGTKAKLKAALLTTTTEDEIGPDPFLSRFDSREPFPQELAGINQGPTVWPASYGPARGTPAIARATPLNPPSRKEEVGDSPPE